MVDEFEVFRARAFGCRETDDNVDDAANDDDEFDSRRHRRSQRRHDNERTNGDSSSAARQGSGDNEDKREKEDGHHGRQWSNRRQRLNTQVTVSVEPPSPTELFPVSPADGDIAQHTHQSRHHRHERHHSRDKNEDGDSTEARGLQRTRTMPARRTRSPSTAGSPQRVSNRELQKTSNSHEIQQCVNDNESSLDQALNLEPENGNTCDDCDDVVHTEPAEPEVECKVYRVRSFSTKKGGSFVNRGDSIKVCSRRGSRQDVLLLTAPSGETALHRRNSTSGPLGNGNRSRRGSSIGLHHDLDGSSFTATQRRNSINCVGLQLTTSECGTSPIRRRSVAPPGVDYSTIAVDGNLTIQTSGSLRRASLRISPSSNGNDVLIVSQTSPSRRSSILVAASEFFGLTSGHDEQGVVNDNNLFSEDEDGGGQHNGGHVTEVFKVMVIGSHGVGKTTLTQQLQTSEYLANNSENDQDDDTTDHVVSVRLDDVESMVHFIDNHNPDVELLANYHNVSETVGSVDAMLVVWSVTDRSSFIYAQTCLQDMKRQHLLADGVSILLVANKQDLVRNRIVSESEGKRLASKRHCKYIEVSALLDHKVDDVLVTIIRQTRQRKEKEDFQMDDTGRQSDDDKRHVMGCFHRASVAFCRKLFK